MYEQVKSNKRDGESFSEAVERLIGGRSLTELADIFDEQQVDEMRGAIDAADRVDQNDTQELGERFE